MLRAKRAAEQVSSKWVVKTEWMVVGLAEQLKSWSRAGKQQVGGEDRGDGGGDSRRSEELGATMGRNNQLGVRSFLPARCFPQTCPRKAWTSEPNSDKAKDSFVFARCSAMLV